MYQNRRERFLLANRTLEAQSTVGRDRIKVSQQVLLSEALRQACINLNRWRRTCQTKICADVKLHIGNDNPRHRRVEAHESGLLRGISIVV
jgi:hypothetical protein